MTLNITLVSRWALFQSGDFRLTDLSTRPPTPRDFAAHKQFIVGAHDWQGLVSFAGIGRTGDGIAVADWLGDLVWGYKASRNSVDAFVEELRGADRWLTRVPRHQRFHTFTLAAFDERHVARAYVVSTFESTHMRPATSPSERLAVSKLTIGRPTILLAGRPGSVTRSERDHLLSLLRSDEEPRTIQEAMASVNRRAHSRDSAVGEACYASHLRVNGREESTPFGVPDGQPLSDPLEFLRRLGIQLRPALDEQGRPKAIQVKGSTFASSAGQPGFRREVAMMERGNLAEAIALFDRAIAENRDPALAHFNKACALCGLGKLEAAFESLEQAFHLGFVDTSLYQSDPDLAPIRADPELNPRLEAMLRSSGSPA